MLTSIPGRDVPSVGIPHVDKVVHVLLYAVLGLLVARALRPADPSRRPALGALLVALVAVALFAALDEWHQQWVPGRSTDVLDWYADLAGGTFALLLGARPASPRRRFT